MRVLGRLLAVTLGVLFVAGVSVYGVLGAVGSWRSPWSRLRSGSSARPEAAERERYVAANEALLEELPLYAGAERKLVRSSAYYDGDAAWGPVAGRHPRDLRRPRAWRLMQEREPPARIGRIRAIVRRTSP